MKFKMMMVAFLAFAVAISCKLPAMVGPGAPVIPETMTPTPYSQVTLPTVVLNVPSAAVPTSDLPPVDLPFYIDCSVLDPSRQADCDAYITATRDRVYPLLRELTGTSLSTCYDGVYYRIVPDNLLSDYQGQADNNHIIYSLRGSLDAAPAPLHDAHELLHTINFCNGALDQHVFHGAVESYVDLATTGVEWQSAGRERIIDWLETKLLPELHNLGDATPAPGTGSRPSMDACIEIYGDLVTILYYDTGIDNIRQLYSATIAPGPEYDPNPRLLELFGPSLGRQFQVVVNGLKLNPKFQVDIPECGY